MATGESIQNGRFEIRRACGWVGGGGACVCVCVCVGGGGGWAGGWMGEELVYFWYEAAISFKLKTKNSLTLCKHASQSHSRYNRQRLGPVCVGMHETTDINRHDKVTHNRKSLSMCDYRCVFDCLLWFKIFFFISFIRNTVQQLVICQ